MAKSEEKELEEMLNPSYPTASVTYNITSPAGFGLLLTIRRGDEGELLDVMQDTEKYLKDKGYTPEVKRSFGGGGGAKPKDFVEGETCPKCGSPLVKVTYKDKQTGEDKTLIKCSTQKYDFMTKTVSGCDYTRFEDKPTPNVPASPAQRKVLEARGLWVDGMTYTEASELIVSK
jgi:predicted nucleic-acid-binding Zn-ribbon protein